MRIVNKTKVAADEAGSGYVTTSGIYPMHLKGIELSSTPSGAVQANYFFDKAISYGNFVASSDAKGNKELFGFKPIDALAVIEDIESYGTSIDELEELELTFKSSSKTVMVIPEFVDMEVLAHLQFSYELYDGEIKERVAVKRFYRPSDMASSTEIVDNTTAGTKYGTDLEKYASIVLYKESTKGANDAPTPEQVAEWKEAQKSGIAAPVANGGAAKAAGFNGGAARKGFGAPSAGQ